MVINTKTEIERVSAEAGPTLTPQLVTLLQNAVEDGASIGFLRPLKLDLARQYWTDVFNEVKVGHRVLLVAGRGGEIVGSVQLALCSRENGLHRAEVQKLMVHTVARRRGIARKLMAAIEAKARGARRTLLYLDTEPGKPAEIMYQHMGWILAGRIPGYACSPDGHLHGTAIYYRNIAAAAPTAPTTHEH